LQELRARLVAGRGTAPLFDMKRFVRSLEELYFAMWEGKQNAAVAVSA
jgi:predicted O-linked N-acetylglucosamine transferase (SPINDLY family)